MAAFLGVVQTPSAVALVAATTKTVLQITGVANHRVKVLRWGIFFDGTSVTQQPVVVRIIRQTTAGTMTNQAPDKVDASITDTLLTTGQVNATVEPTAGVIMEQIEIHPQQGFAMVYPLGQEIIMAGAGRIGIDATAPAGVNCKAYMVFEE